MATKRPGRRRRPLAVIGWREWIALPEYGVSAIKAKVDTGARTSALHAFQLVVTEEETGPVARFEIHPEQRTASGAVEVSAPVIGWRRVRSSNGEVQERPVIHTHLALGEACWPVEMTLTNRDEMGFRMLLGRAAVRRRFLIDPGRSYVGSRRLPS